MWRNATFADLRKYYSRADISLAQICIKRNANKEVWSGRIKPLFPNWVKWNSFSNITKGEIVIREFYLGDGSRSVLNVIDGWEEVDAIRYIPYSFSPLPLLFLIGNSNSMLNKGIWEKNALDVQIRKMLSGDHNLALENSFLCLFRHVSKTFHLASGHLMISLSLACQTK